MIIIWEGANRGYGLMDHTHMVSEHHTTLDILHYINLFPGN